MRDPSDRPSESDLLKAVTGSSLTRRQLIRGGVVGSAVLTMPGLLAACDDGESAAPSGTPASTGNPQRGGRLRIAVVGGGSDETMDPQKANYISDMARSMNVFDRLTEQGPDGKTAMSLAESVEPNKAGDVWTVRLREGITWHDGKPLTAEDVVYSYRRILTPKEGALGLVDIGMIDPAKVRKLDKRTVELGLHYPYSLLPVAMSQRAIGIVPEGTTNFDKPVGTGPFRFVSLEPGQAGLLKRNPDYWGSEDGQPYLDELEVFTISDESARVNAIIANQVDAIQNPPITQVKQLTASNQDIKILAAKSGAWVPIYMDAARAPFDDVRVRQALRLIVDRKALVEQAVAGFGDVANDLFSPYDSNYAGELIPQREQDLDQAKSLLKQAGRSDLRLTLQSSTAALGMQSSALVYANQAKAAGVAIKVVNNPTDTYYNNVAGKAAFSHDIWGTRGLDAQIRQSVGGENNYTHYKDEQFTKYVKDATQTFDEARQKELFVEAQKRFHENGTYLIWGFNNWVDLYRANVQNLTPSVAQALGYFRFQHVWMA